MKLMRTFSVALLTLVLGLGLMFADENPAKVEKAAFKITGKGNMAGMSCDGCTKRVKNALLGVEGVKSAEVDLAKALAVVEYEAEKVTVEAMMKAVDQANFKAVPLRKVVLNIEGKGDMAGMVCQGCQKRVNEALSGVKGVEWTEVSLARNQAVVYYQSDGVKEKDFFASLEKAVDEAGFKAVKSEPKALK